MTPDIDDHSAPLTAEDFFWLENVESALELGLGLQRWWQQKTASWPAVVDQSWLRETLDSEAHPEAFLLNRLSAQWPEDFSYGFYDEAVVDGHAVPVVGHFQQLLFGRPKGAAAVAAVREAFPGDEGVHRAETLEPWQANLRAFVLNIWHHGHFTTPFAAQPDQPRPLAAYLQPFSLYTSPWETELKRGLVSSQIYYRRRDDGRIGKFWPPDRTGINFQVVDEKFRWIVARLQLESALVRWAPAGRSFPYITVPVESSVVAVITPESLLCDDAGRDDILGTYGLNFIVLGNPVTRIPMRGFGKIRYLLRDSGEIFVQYCSANVRALWLGARMPDPFLWSLELGDRLTRGLLSPLLHPLKKGVDLLPLRNSVEIFLPLLNLFETASDGIWGRHLGLTRKQIEKRLLVADMVSFMRTIRELTSLWRSVLDWNDPPG